MVEFNSLNPELNTKQIIMTEHAYERVAERLGLKDRKQALGQIRSMLRTARRIGNVINSEGEESVLYAFGRVAIYLTTDLSRVKTVIKMDDLSYLIYRDKIKQMYDKELRKLERSEKSKRRKLKLEKLRLNAEIAQLQYRMAKTRSEKVKKESEEQIKNYISYLETLEIELKEILASKYTVAKALVTLCEK
jgi:hypothetical protein